jgi:iron complex outermembrane receptor protein
MNAHWKLLLLIMTSSFVKAGGAASLSGMVRDQQSHPVAGASIVLFSQNGSASWNANSDSHGAWSIERLPAGQYILRIAAPGFATFVSEAINLDGEPGQPLDITLQLAAVRDEVVVTAASTPQSPEKVSRAATVIDAAEADTRDSNSLAEAVNLAPGVRVQQLGGPGSFASLQIRGMRPEDTAVLVDGLRLRDASATQADASGLIEDLLFTDTDRIEVLRGSGSSLYGTNAMGGVVNVITDQGGGRTRGSVLVEGGSLGTMRARAQVAGGSGHDGVEYSLGVSQLYAAGGVGGNLPYRDTNVQGRATFHVSPATQLSARLYAGNSFGKLATSAQVIGNPSGLGVINAVPLSDAAFHLYELGTPISQLNTGSATFIPAPDNPDYTRAARYITGALILTGQPSTDLSYTISYQSVANSRRYGDGPAGVSYQPIGNTRSLYDGRIHTVNAHLDYRLGAHNLVTAGYEFENENYANDNSASTSSAAASATSATQNSHSVFVQDQVRLLGDRLQISGAFRAQVFSLDAPSFLPLASAPYQGIAFASPTPAYTGDGSVSYFFRSSGTKLRAHAGRGYRAPSLFERFGTGFDPTFGYSVYGDPRLKPEHSISMDAGVDQRFWHDRLKASATYFYTALQNIIVFDTSGLIDSATDPFGRFIGYANEKGGLSRGVELSGAVSPIRSLNISAAYTYVNAIERAPIVGDVLRTFIIPRNQFSILATERVNSRLLLTFDTLASSSYLAPLYGTTATQTYRFDGIHKINLGASYRVSMGEYRALRFFFRAENLSGQEYFESGFRTPGRTGMGGMQVEF